MKMSDKIKLGITVISLGVITGLAAFYAVQSEFEPKPKQPDKENPRTGEIEVEVTYEPIKVVEPVEEVDEIIFDNDYDNMIYQATKDTEVDPYLAISISRLETGHYTSKAFVEGNNFGGITVSGEVASFDSIDSGLDRYVSLLGWYHRNGMTTAETMQATYCPPNENWDEVVNDIYETMISEVK